MLQIQSLWILLPEGLEFSSKFNKDLKNALCFRRPARAQLYYLTYVKELHMFILQYKTFLGFYSYKRYFTWIFHMILTTIMG